MKGKKEKLFKEIKMLFLEFETQHNSKLKESSKKARLTLTELKNLILEYKLASVEEQINL